MAGNVESLANSKALKMDKMSSQRLSTGHLYSNDPVDPVGQVPVQVSSCTGTTFRPNGPPELLPTGSAEFKWPVEDLKNETLPIFIADCTYEDEQQYPTSSQPGTVADPSD